MVVAVVVAVVVVAVAPVALMAAEKARPVSSAAESGKKPTNGSTI